MEFLQPSLLWGMLAVAIPIAIHLWHQKKGKVIAWAATQWLLEKSQQSKRGLRFDNLLLLALRCLVLIVLVMILAEPFIKKSDSSPTMQKVHVVQPDAFVVDNYRFELEKAQQKGERMYWLTPTLPTAEELSTPFTEETKLSPVLLQHAMNQLAEEDVALHFYVKNERSLAQLPTIQTPEKFQLHVVPDTLRPKVRPYWLAANNQKLFINATNRLQIGNADPVVTFASEPVGEGTLRVRIDLKNPTERKTVEAALRAFAEVYSLHLVLNEEKTNNGDYSVLVTNDVPVLVRPTTLYVVTGQPGRSAFPTVIYTSDTLTPQASSMVANGQLPEWLGEHILDHIGLSGDSAPLTQAELNTLFEPMKSISGESSAGTQRVFFLILLVLITLERGIALSKNA